MEYDGGKLIDQRNLHVREYDRSKLTGQRDLHVRDYQGIKIFLCVDAHDTLGSYLTDDAANADPINVRRAQGLKHVNKSSMRIEDSCSDFLSLAGVELFDRLSSREMI